MHFMPDTEDQDSAAETFWPEGYKQLIREKTPELFRERILRQKPFLNLCERHYCTQYTEYSHLADRLAEILAVALENGADDAFDEIVDAFLKEARLPDLRSYALYDDIGKVPASFQSALTDIILSDYEQDNIYQYAYTVGYKQEYPFIGDYFQRIAMLVINGGQNRVQDTLEKIYAGLYYRRPLPPARRYPRRLKVW